MYRIVFRWWGYDSQWGDISTKCFSLVFGILMEVPHHLVSGWNSTNAAFPGSDRAGNTLFRSGALTFNTLVDVIGVFRKNSDNMKTMTLGGTFSDTPGSFTLQWAVWVEYMISTLSVTRQPFLFAHNVINHFTTEAIICIQAILTVVITNRASRWNTDPLLYILYC